MDIAGFLSSISLIAILAFVITVLILLFELRHIFFRKKIAAHPTIPDFDGNMHTAPEHATLIDVESLDNGGVNKALITILLIVLFVLIVVIVVGFMYGRKKLDQTKPTVLTPSIIPTAIIEIEQISPTSPFGEIVEIPFDLSQAPEQVANTPGVGVINKATNSAEIKQVISPSIDTKVGTVTSQVNVTDAGPSLPASGGLSSAMLFAILPFLLLTAALLL